MKFSIWRSTLLRVAILVMQLEVKSISKKKVYLSSISTPLPLLRESFPGNRVIRHEVKLISKKRSLHLSSVPTPCCLCIESQTFVRRCNFTILPKFNKNFRIISRAALKGFEGREFDTPVIGRDSAVNIFYNF